MKRIILIFIGVLFLKTSFSQVYRPFDSTTVWASEYAYKYSSSTCYLLESDKYYLKGYTTDLGRIWYKVYVSKVTIVHPSSFCSSAPTLPPSVYNGLLGYVHNDVINKKVYFKYSAPSNYTLTPVDVLYNFNKNVGDSLYVKNIAPMYKFKINSIDSILFSGNYHKRFLVTCVPAAINRPNPMSFVEGIGSSMGPFEPLINGMGEAWTDLLCFASPTQTLAVTNHSAYTNSSICNNFVLGINETKTETSISVYPNPASDQVFVSKGLNTEEKLNYSIINLLGSVQQTGIIENEENKIQLKGIPTGVYFLKIFTNDKTILTKKITILKD